MRAKRHFATVGACRLLGLLLRPAGACYGLLMRCRRSAYRRGWRRSEHAAVPTICVGNLTVGGTGKTPMVAWLVRYLRSRGYRPAVLTRGYKSRRGQSDEAQLLAQLADAPVVANPDRLAGARRAVAAGADVLVLDDGFQHLRLRRDFNLVLFDATNPFGGGFFPGAPLPAGRMREPLSALADAHALVLTRSDQVPPERLADLWANLAEQAPHAVLASAVHRPRAVLDETGCALPVERLAGRKVFLFCGLGNPEGFFRTVVSLGANVVGVRRLGDHARYPPALLRNLRAEATRQGAEFLLTTQKDGVKIPDAPAAPPVYQLAVEMEITDGCEELLEALHRAISAEPGGKNIPAVPDDGETAI